MCDFVWTRKPPTEPGWYWYKERLSPSESHMHILEVVRYDLDHNVLVVAGSIERVDEMSVEWAGPISTPRQEALRGVFELDTPSGAIEAMEGAAKTIQQINRDWAKSARIEHSKKPK